MEDGGRRIGIAPSQAPLRSDPHRFNDIASFRRRFPLSFGICGFGSGAKRAAAAVHVQLRVAAHFS